MKWILIPALLMAGCMTDATGPREPQMVVLSVGWDSLAIDHATITWDYGGEPCTEYVARRAGGWTDSAVAADSARLRVSSTGDFWACIEVSGEPVAYARDTTGAGLVLIGWHE